MSDVLAWPGRSPMSGSKRWSLRPWNSSRPSRDGHWSTRSMGREAGMSQTAISRVWWAFGLRPHLVGRWKLSTDPRFIDEVCDVVGLNLDPPDMAVVSSWWMRSRRCRPSVALLR
jgi:hypothetical protein